MDKHSELIKRLIIEGLINRGKAGFFAYDIAVALKNFVIIILQFVFPVAVYIK